MGTSNPVKAKIQKLKAAYDTLRQGKNSLLQMIDEAEIPESVYNSNAIENSTLTLKETEIILLEMELSRDVDLREVFEAKKLARVTNYTRKKTPQTELNEELILLLHKMLIETIDDKISGRWRKKGEYVRVGTHVAPPPEKVESMIKPVLVDYTSNLADYFLDRIAKFHLDFETIHPFVDGNGRIGRVIINYQLLQLSLPGIIIRDKEKKAYYSAFNEYRIGKNTKPMERIVAQALTEALHKRLAYLQHEEIVLLAEYGRKHKRSLSTLLNAASRQTIPAFRERGVWKIGASFRG